MSRHATATLFGPEVEAIIYEGRGDIARHGRHELHCPGALAQAGEVYPCELHPEHDGWAHSNHEAGAIWQ